MSTRVNGCLATAHSWQAFRMSRRQTHIFLEAACWPRKRDEGINPNRIFPFRRCPVEPGSGFSCQSCYHGHPGSGHWFGQQGGHRPTEIVNFCFTITQCRDKNFSLDHPSPFEWTRASSFSDLLHTSCQHGGLEQVQGVSECASQQPKLEI